MVKSENGPSENVGVHSAGGVCKPDRQTDRTEIGLQTRTQGIPKDDNKEWSKKIHEQIFSLKRE